MILIFDAVDLGPDLPCWQLFELENIISKLVALLFVHVGLGSYVPSGLDLVDCFGDVQLHATPVQRDPRKGPQKWLVDNFVFHRGAVFPPANSNLSRGVIRGQLGRQNCLCGNQPVPVAPALMVSVALCMVMLNQFGSVARLG